jgi:putative ABC transport system substrate-binding protein
VDVIVAAGTPAALAAQRATDAIPIVAIGVSDPVASGLVGSIAHPGGNVTGLSILAPALSAKRLELLRDCVPGLARVSYLWDPTNPGSALSRAATEAAAETLGLQLQLLEVLGPANFDGAFAAAAAARDKAVLVGGGSTTRNHRAQIVGLAAQHRVPAMYETRDFVEVGGLMNYGPNRPSMVRRSAYYVDKILKGVSPADLPVEQPREFDFVISLKTAQALGLTIPQHVLLQATEVIQ